MCSIGYSDTTFLATFTEATPTVTNPVVFDFDAINSGDNYNSATGIYTVPVDGVYQFTVHFLQGGDPLGSAFLVVDNARVGPFYSLIWSQHCFFLWFMYQMSINISGFLVTYFLIRFDDANGVRTMGYEKRPERLVNRIYWEIA